MVRVYLPRHPKLTVFYRALFHYFNRFLALHESRFNKQHDFSAGLSKEVLERYLDGSNFRRRICPYTLPPLGGGALTDVPLSLLRLLSFVPLEELGGMWRVDEGDTPSQPFQGF